MGLPSLFLWSAKVSQLSMDPRRLTSQKSLQTWIQQSYCVLQVALSRLWSLALPIMLVSPFTSSRAATCGPPLSLLQLGAALPFSTPPCAH